MSKTKTATGQETATGPEITKTSKLEETVKQEESIKAAIEYQWRCTDCDAVAPGTRGGYMTIITHKKGHHVQLVNVANGEVLATNLKQVDARGINLPSSDKGSVKDIKPTPSDDDGDAETAPAKDDKGTKTSPPKEPKLEMTEEGITSPITLPTVVFTLFQAGKAGGRIPPDMDIDEWLYECVIKRFELDYKFQLMLVPITEEQPEE